MEIYNTLTRKKEVLPSPDKQKHLKMFVCGPTVYDYIHIGNARTFVFFDVVAKYLKFKGFDVNYIQNITDIDDKIINRASQENKTWKEVADFYFEEFKKDTQALGINTPKYIKATDHIEDVKKQVKILKTKGHVYLIPDDGWYFDLKTFSDYGKLSGRNAEMADDAVSRIDESEKKRSKGDFCVWKLAKPGESWWDDEDLGDGRPGWHIEDTAITEENFGPQYDIHGGGQDLIFPHHEAEIAQQESASGLKPFVKYWMHVGFLVNKEEKMSKSLGNFTIAHELLQKYSKEVLRFYLLSSYYRSPLDFSEKSLKQSSAAIQRISELKKILEITDDKGKNTIKVNGIELPEYIKTTEKKFHSAIDDDFNTPEALACVFNIIRGINLPLRFKAISKEYAKLVLGFLNKVDQIFGIIPTSYEGAPSGVVRLVKNREKFREENNYEEADKIRAQINDLGYEIEDTVYGPLIDRAPK